MRNRITATILRPDPEHCFLHVESRSPAGDEVYAISCRIDDNPDLHAWLLAESWSKVGYGGGIHVQRPSAQLCEALGTPPKKPMGLAEVIGRLSVVGGEPVTKVRCAGHDCRLVAMNVVQRVPVDAAGKPLPQAAPKLMFDDPKFAEELAAKKAAAEKATNELLWQKGTTRENNKQWDKEQREKARSLKSATTKASKEFLRKARELAGIKAEQYKWARRAAGDRWASGEGYANLMLTDGRTKKECDEAGISEADEEYRINAPCRAAEERERPLEARYHDILNSWRPQQLRWDELSPTQLKMYDDALDLFIAGVHSHAAGYTDEQIGELFWSEPEREHIIIDEAYYKEHRRDKRV